MVGYRQNNCAKYFIFIFNFLFGMAGVLVFAVSIAFVLNSDFKNYILNLTNLSNQAPIQLNELNFLCYLLAVLGAFTFITGFIGCAGAICENACLLGIFFSVIMLLFLTELGCLIAIMANLENFHSSFNSFYYGIIIPQYVEGYSTKNDLVQIVDQIQAKFNCCGCYDYNDFYNQGWPPNKTLLTCTSNYQAQSGCCSLLWSEIQESLKTVSGVTGGILIIECLAMVFICCLCNSMKNRKL